METKERNLNSSADEKKEEQVSARKPYKKPSLNEYGDIAELTQNVGVDGDDGNQGSHVTLGPVRRPTPTPFR